MYFQIFIQSETRWDHVLDGQRRGKAFPDGARFRIKLGRSGTLAIEHLAISLSTAPFEIGQSIAAPGIIYLWI
jgi:hypothetical protein